MKHIACRTEFSYRFAYGPLPKVLAAGGVGICDRNGTWGHVRWAKECKAKGIKPLFGVELAVVEHAKQPEKQPPAWYRFIAKNLDGLSELYQLVTLASRGFYYYARLERSALSNVSRNLIMVVPGQDWARAPLESYVELVQNSNEANVARAIKRGLFPLALVDNRYPAPVHKKAYEIVAGRNKEFGTHPMHMLNQSEWEFNTSWGRHHHAEALANAEQVYASSCGLVLPKAQMIKFSSPKTLAELCVEGAVKRNIDLNNDVYAARLERELDMIKRKDFADYFFVLADMISYAKQHMLVGPARGSSCGSLVCYLLGITDIDPMPFGLLFERFIDITREDLPDIDVDFQDDRREMVFEYLRQKYGAQHVARIGNVNRYKAASALRDVSSALKIPLWEVDAVKNAMLKRSTGDARAAFCIMDTFNDIEVGRELLKKYPELAVAADLENHASHSGQHAAGTAITQEPISTYCSIDEKLGVAQLDKKDAEDLGILKIDALGLRTLSVIQACLDDIGWTREQLLACPFEEKEAFEIINKGKFSGIFQFEGAALQNLCRQMKVENFEDIVSLTALARPGPLVSGGSTDFLNRRTGKEPVKYLHPLAKTATEVTLGCIVYQEQVMQLGREIGSLSWEDVSTLRKAMSKSFGKEYFDKFFEKFWDGAEKNGLTMQEAKHVWEHMNTMGCLSGETELINPFPNHAYGRTIKLKDLAKTGGYIRKRAEYTREFKSPRRQKKHDSIKMQQLYSMRSGKIKPERCVDAFYSGIKQTLKLKTAGGHSIRATSNHPFWAHPGQWKELCQLKPGDLIAAAGQTPATKRKTKTGTGSGAHNERLGIAWTEAHRKFKKKYKLCQVCKSAQYEETHHKDHDWKNNRPDNLLALCRSCHKSLHKKSVPHSRGKEILWTPVLSIGSPCEEKVYDISMPSMNFVAEGLVVHNSWSFNRSHAVAYGLVSYWCCLLKARYPLEFAAACLRNARDDDQVVSLLRELVREGFEYKPFDRSRSTENWSVCEGVLIGGLSNIKGVGEVMAKEICRRRDEGIVLSNRMEKLLSEGVTPFDLIFAAEDLFGEYYTAPEKFKITSGEVERINNILIANRDRSNVLFLGKLLTKNVRDAREAINVQRDINKSHMGNPLSLNFNVEDDTGFIKCKIGTKDYLRLGVEVVETGILNESWYLIKGRFGVKFNMVFVDKIRKLK